MRLPILKQCCLAFITSIVIALSACDEEPNSENAIQSSLDTLMVDLQIATLGSNIEGLESVVSSASKIRPVAQSQIQSKNLLLSTAKEKLAQLKFQLLSAKTTATLPLLTLAEDQAIQSSILRNVADTLSQINTIDGLLSNQITSTQYEKRAHFNGQLTSATSVLDSLSSQSEVSRNKADGLLEEAELLLNNAEDAGLIEGHAEYKSGVKTLRKAQLETLAASTIELQSSMRTKPLLEDARAELESIASILNGMEHSDALLQQLRDVTRKNASDFRTLADELDSLAAETMNSGIEASEKLKQEWDALSTLVQDALRSANQSRSRSREIQQTSGIWKLDLEWTLGQIEEAKRSFLLEEQRTLQTFIELGIVTSKEKWRELSTSTNAEVEQATLNAMSAFENAKQLADNAGQQGVALIAQLDNRLAVLQGKAIAVPATDRDSGNNTPTTSNSSGFSTPEDLVAAFNEATDIPSFDGTSPPVGLNQFYEFEDEKAAQMIAFLNNTIQTTGNLLVAIRTHIGADAVAQFISTNAASTQSVMMKIEPSSLVQVDNTSATAREQSGKPVRLQQTNQGWKIMLATKGNAESEMAFSMMSEMFTPMIEVMNGITSQINDGEITTVEQINEAMMAAVENMNPF